MDGPSQQKVGGKNTTTKADQIFEEIVADLANTRFNKTVFEGTATAQAFEWGIAMETYWSAHYGRQRELDYGCPSPRNVEIGTKNYMARVV